MNPKKHWDDQVGSPDAIRQPCEAADRFGTAHFDHPSGLASEYTKHT